MMCEDQLSADRPWWDTSHIDCEAEGSPTLTGGVFEQDWTGEWPMVCTLKKGHDGPHVAEDVFDAVVGSWPQRRDEDRTPQRVERERPKQTKEKS